MISAYLGLCLEKCNSLFIKDPNTIPERLSLLERRDIDMIEFMRQNEVSIPREFVNDSKSMLTHLQKFVGNYA